MPPIRREPPVLLVFIQGRWQSVPPGSGFAVSRRGKLEELRSGTVRSALRRLQMCLPSKARLGPRLSFKKIPPSDGEYSDNNVNVIEPKNNILQNRDVRPCKRTRDTTSSEEPIKSVTTVATIHPAKLPKTSKNHQLCMIRLLSSESKSSEASRTELKNQKSKEIMESPKKSSGSSRILLDSPKQNLILKQRSPILKSKDLSEKQISRYLQPRSAKLNKSPKKVDKIISDSDFEIEQSEILKSKMKKNHSAIKIISSESGTKIEKLTKNNQNHFHKIGTKRQKLDQDTSDSQSPRAENIFQRPNDPTDSKIGTCKELEISEEDIELLRIFLQNHYSDRVLLKFDADDEYKRMIFFRINPLVDIEWCPIIDRMLRRSQDSQLTLTDFASNLGLRSVTEATSIKTQRYKIRNRTTKSYVDSDSDSSSDDKENNDKMPRRIEKTKILKEREHNMRESNKGENKAQNNKNKVSNKRALTRKRESDPEVCITKENNKKVGIAIERTTRPNHKTVESESEDSNAKENNKKSVLAKKRTSRTNYNTARSDSENNNKVEKVKDRAKTINRDSEASNTKENIKKASSTKKQTKWEERNKADTDSEASNAIKHNSKDSNAKKQTKREKRNSDDDDSQGSNAKIVDRNQRDKDNTVDISSESETEIAVKAIKKTVKPKTVISSKRRRTNLEYSSLEDHAIVAWVSTGSRASRVNGNLLWRQLQDQYTQITGSRRTWHSLRNRYLRYILPKLGDLALPLSQQTRLRAAAATGEIKAHKMHPRRNSIFKLPPRGAASKRIAQTKDDTETEDKELPSKRSPRYSSLTRQFTRRNNMARPSSELSDTSQRSNKLEVGYNAKEKSEEISPKKPYKAINSPRKQTNSRAVRNERSDSNGRGESPKDSGDSSSKSEVESKKINELRRTRRSVNESNKRMSRRDTRQNTNDPKLMLKRQSNIQDESDESKGRKSRDVADKLKSAKEKKKESPRGNLNRNKSPSEQSSRESSVSMSQSRRKSPENNRRRSRRHAIKKNESDAESNESKSRKSPGPINRSPTRKSNRNKSPSILSSKGSNTSVSQVRRDVQSKSPIKHKNTRHESSSEESDSSSGSVSQPRRKSNRINLPQDRSNIRKSNRLDVQSKSPIKRKNTRHDSSSEESDSSSGSVSQPRRKSNRISLPKDRSNIRKSNRLTPNESSNKRRHSSESKRKSKLAKRDSLDEIVVSDSSESFEPKKVIKDLNKKVNPPNKRVDKQKMRKLFNPKAIL